MAQLVKPVIRVMNSTKLSGLFLSLYIYIYIYIYKRKEEYKQISDVNEQGKTNNVKILNQIQSILKYNKNKKNKNRYNKNVDKNKIILLKFITKINTGDIGYRGERRWVTDMSYRGE
jgi:hypothetical protein